MDEPRQPPVSYLCEKGHHSTTTNHHYRLCAVRSQSAKRGVFGPECGAEIVSVTLDIDDFDEMLGAVSAAVIKAHEDGYDTGLRSGRAEKWESIQADIAEAVAAAVDAEQARCRVIVEQSQEDTAPDAGGDAWGVHGVILALILGRSPDDPPLIASGEAPAREDGGAEVPGTTSVPAEPVVATSPDAARVAASTTPTDQPGAWDDSHSLMRAATPTDAEAET